VILQGFSGNRKRFVLIQDMDLSYLLQIACHRPKTRRPFRNDPKKRLHEILQVLGAVFSYQTTFGAIFAHIFSDFVNIFIDFAHIVTDFARIFRDFAQIFDISKHLGVRLHRLHP